MSPCFGRTRVAKSKTAALFSLFGLLLSGLVVQPGPASGLATPSLIASTPLSLGFGPTSLSPLSEGVPVYTVGETIWAESGFPNPVSISLISPTASGSKVSTITLLQPDTITPVYKFATNDADGLYNLTISGNQGTVVIPVHFVKASNQPASLGPLSYSLAGGNITISSKASLGDSYDQEVCAGGPASSQGISFALPDALGLGKVTVSPGSQINLVTSGLVNQSFNFWFELFHPYSLEAPDTNSLVLNNLMTAQSVPVTFVGAGTSATSLTLNMPLRDGRYDMRAFFQNSTALSVYESRILVLNSSSWVSLTGSCEPETVQTSSVAYSTSLTHGQENWPTHIYLMYRTLGVEAVEAYPVTADISSVDFVSSIGGTLLHNFTVNVTPPAGVQTTQGKDLLFVLAPQYPVTLGYSLDFAGGHEIYQGTVNVTAKGASLTAELLLAKLTVHVISDQSAPTSLLVTGANGVKESSGPLGDNMSSSFLLPTGSYAVTASQGGNSEMANVGLTNGLATGLTLNFNTFQSFEIILIVTAIMAAVANGAIWIANSRSLRARLAK